MRLSNRSIQPNYLVQAAAHRLSVTAYLGGGVFLLYTLLYRFVWPEESNALAQAIGWAEVALSLVVALRVPKCSEQQIVIVATLYELALCLGIEIGNLTAPNREYHSNLVSWSCVVIVFFPILLVARPSVMLLGSTAAACMAPLTYVTARVLFGFPELPLGVLVIDALPLFVCAVLAYIPAKVVYELGADVNRAKHLGSYELLEKLGEGGMGEVWTARHSLLARPAAVKLIREDLHDAQLVTRFEREAQVTGSLESPHTVQLYDFGVSDSGAFYYVMELLRGANLETLVEKTGPLPPERVVYLLLQVCDSLQEAHNQGLVHRDIKPANLFVTRRAQAYDFVKVLDFGLVKITQTNTDDDLTATAAGKIIGTPAYLPPEMTVGEQVVDGRADLYALGCVAYFLLTSELVFTADNPIKVAIAHATKPPLPLTEHPAAQVPSELSDIVLQCLEKNVDDRPASALELARALRATGLADQWSSDIASEWWEHNWPELFAEPGRDLPESQASRWLNPAPKE